MHRLIDFLEIFKEYLLLLACVVISLVLLALNDSPQIQSIRSYTIGSIGLLHEVFGFIPNYFSLTRENAALRTMNLSLSEEVSRLREAGIENAHLREMLELKQRSRFRYVAAEVIGKSLHLMHGTITIDVGRVDGVTLNMPIVTDGGLVGRVVATSDRYSVGQILLNRDFRASARVQRQRVDGILVWEGGRLLKLKHVAKTLDVQVGDAVVTSEYSSMFPAGIKVGVVTATSQAPGALFEEIEVIPAVDFASLEDVFVILHAPDSSRIVLEQRFPR
jgi:rod shape-determining protein MreC